MHPTVTSHPTFIPEEKNSSSERVFFKTSTEIFRRAATSATLQSPHIHKAQSTVA
jgi:hypothetical protein